jgi:glycosyltransferase involved in cell wall biosynthesis
MPIDFPRFATAKKAESALNLLIVGRIVESKNIELAVRALSKFRNFAWKLEIIGDGSHLPSIQNLISSSGLAERITCHGRVPSTSDWYRKADLFLFTSKLDNCPLVVLEAMSFGVPVLAVRSDGRDFITGVDEMICSGTDGLLADGETGFADSIREVLQNPAKLQELGSKAVDRVRSRNSWDAHIAFVEGMFVEIMNERDPVNQVHCNGVRIAKRRRGSWHRATRSS